MPIRLYNTLTRGPEEFQTLEPGKVRMYTCGPTVYNFAHIGNLRAFASQDVLKRHLKWRGYDVRHVMNLTDVEDKIIKTCRTTGESLASLTGRFARHFLEDLDTLQIQRPDVMPRATEHIDEMVAFIQDLMAKGHAYRADDGSVYFKLTSFPDYGKLSHFDMDQLQTGASGRVEVDEYAQEDARDFALWKAWDEDDGDIFWETALGKGRPGWHIECSAMSMKYLGETFDLHLGGVDLIFPHHENEIAQSEANTGKTFVKHWVHSAHLLVDGRKMSKSLGNIYTLREVLEKGYDPLAVRWVLIATHYRQPNNFTFEAVDAAAQSLGRIRDFRLRLREVTGEGSSLEAETAECRRLFGEAMDDDINISGALGVVFNFIRDTNRIIDERGLGAEGVRKAEALLDDLDRVTGLFNPSLEEAVPQGILDLVLERQQARRSKDFKRADEIRDELAAEGWVLEDTPDGPRVKRSLERRVS
ncbi:MAG: cysteine--tRNA ligase [FCB group bacterium]|jgi:cysteinyl-tRNA synthetase|nr:cysteine--tRNA ligase [FCB group bacterium]